MRDRYSLFLITMGLTLLGVTMVFSSSGVYADREFSDSLYFLKRELIWALIGFLSLSFAYRISLFKLQSWALVIFALSMLLIGLTYTDLGIKVGGAQRWLRFGPFNFQPSEFMKYALVILLAGYFGGQPDYAKGFWKGFIFSLFLIVISVLPILFQPDFGTAVMIAGGGFLMLFVAGVKVRYLGALILSVLPMLYFAIVCFPYRVNRIAAFLDPWKDPTGNGFQMVQSFLAIGRGGLSGVGLGESTQKLFYLPEAHTDFIFSILAEELGYIGSVLTIGAFIIFTVIAFGIALRTKHRFGHLLAAGCTFMICIQAILNIAVVTGTVPPKGIPLPFISFGGSNLMMNLIAVGLIMNVSKSLEQGILVEEGDKTLVTEKRWEKKAHPLRQSLSKYATL
ncbi:MAG: putative lipid II flippase FtsW [Candidatus Aureabacteria bacterium]|nr:putative lipid II flippase FtsW [Candidatus Auribacterota bacterium]